MNYNETIDYLYNAAPAFEKVGASAYKPGLYNTIALDEHTGKPHTAYKTVHVAGTNGKGSTSHTIAALLQAAGMRVGLYTSPHLVTFRERMKVNGEMVSEEYVVNWVERNREFFEPLHPSFFELTTAMALEWFRDQKVDIAVIEVGLGGRLDCTNIISPILSVITNIAFDHTQFLGNTLSAIASEKAGIIKKGVPVVIGETTPETRPVFEAKAKEVGAPIIFAEDCQYVISSSPASDGGRDYTTRCFGSLHGQLGGACQEHNVNTFLNCLMPLGRALLAEHPMSPVVPLIHKALEQVCTMTGLNGRWQKLGDNPLCVCDTGHNPAGWQYLAPQIRSIEADRKHIVFGMVDDKDISTVLAMLPKDATYYFTNADSHRAIPAEKVRALAEPFGLQGSQYPDVITAYRAAMAAASPSDFVFIGGSSYVVADLLTALQA